MSCIPAGGPATFSGVHYQLLWTLLIALRLRIKAFRPADSVSARATIRVEPAGGGGDVQVQFLGGREVQQIKARSDEGAWSLAEIVRDVLPDLYLAVDLHAPVITYQLVTEGRRGTWGEGERDDAQAAETFFRSLRGRVPGDRDWLGALDDTISLKRFTAGPKKRASPIPAQSRDGTADAGTEVSDIPVWTADAYTERGLFERIVEVLKRRSEIREEPDADIHEKLWHLLGRFEMVEARRQDEVRQEIDGLLRPMVERVEEVEGKRFELLGRLTAKAAAGNVEITAEGLLQEAGVTALPLTAWEQIRARARRPLEHELKGLYAPFRDEDDVRPGWAAEVLANWTTRVLVLAGASGQGKSWLQAALATRLQQGPAIVIWLSATGDADKDLSRAARTFSSAWNRDEFLPLDRTAERLREGAYPDLDPWLIVAVDGVQSVPEAQALARSDWEAWRVRLILTCSETVGEQLRETEGAQVVNVREFSPLELADFLRRHLGAGWSDVPDDVRETLRRPLLASIYCRIAAQGRSAPSREYELYESYWNQLFTGEQAEHPLDASGLRSLALQVLEAKPYPWSARRVRNAEVDPAALGRLSRVGWLRKASGDHFEIPHDRFLNWAVAEGIADAVREGETNLQEVNAWLAAMTSPGRTWSGRSLAYVPMDLFWLGASPSAPLPAAAEAVISALTTGDLWAQEHVYHNLLPTAGPRAVPYLYPRLAHLALEAGESDWYLVNGLIGGIVSIDHPSVGDGAALLLQDPHPKIQRAAMRILAERPTPAALPRLWQIHGWVRANPDYFEPSRESSFADPEYALDALAAALPLQPAWLEQAIADAPARDPLVVDLARLSLFLDDANAWRRCKIELFERTPAEGEIYLAQAIGQYRDGEEIDWLAERLSSENRRLAGVTLRSLARLDTEKALAAICDTRAPGLPVGSAYALHHLITSSPADTLAALRNRMASFDDPWALGGALRGAESLLDSETLDRLLDAFETRLDDLPVEGTANPLYRPLLILAAANSLSHLPCFERRRDSSLEEKLAGWLLARGPRRSPGEDLPEREPGVAVLQKVAGAGFVRVVNQWLGSDSPYAREDGAALAAKRADADTVTTLIAITRRETTGDRRPKEQRRAVESLLELGHGVPVAEAMIRWGSTYETLLAPPHPPLSDPEETGAVIYAAMAQEPTPPGAVLTVAIFRRSVHLGRIRQLLATNPEQKLAWSCIMALQWCRDESPQAVQLLADRLSREELRSFATHALITIGTPAAEDALLQDLRERYDVDIAVNLLNRSSNWRAVVDVVRPHLDPDDWRTTGERLLELLRYVSSDEALQSLLQNTELREQVAELAAENERASLWGDTKVLAIRALSLFRPDLAFPAARDTLAKRDARERERYPGQLVDIDPDGAVDVLLDQASDEHSTSVLWSIGRALAPLAIEPSLLEMMTSPDVKRRRAACQLAAFRPPTQDVEEGLCACLADADDEVVEAATNSILRLRAARQLEELLGAMKEERDPFRRRTILDALTSLGDPGDAHRPWPGWVQHAAEYLPALGCAYLTQELVKRRKELEDDARRQDKRR